jgi:hypothetical protein
MSAWLEDGGHLLGTSRGVAASPLQMGADPQRGGVDGSVWSLAGQIRCIPWRRGAVRHAARVGDAGFGSGAQTSSSMRRPQQ